MGHSRIYNYIGYSEEFKKNDGTIVSRMYPVNNKKEIAQARMEAKKDGKEIEYWIAQTQRGARGLNAPTTFYAVADENVKTRS